MKSQMLTLIIGILIGAIIATGVFLVLKNSDSSNDTMEEMSSGRGMTMGENFIGGGEMTIPDDIENTVSE